MAANNLSPRPHKPAGPDDDSPSSSLGSFGPGVRRPDTLKLTCQLGILRHLHSTATAIEECYGDKAEEKMVFIAGVQGRITKPTWNRDYTYFLAKIDEVRVHLQQHCVRSVLDDLLQTLLDIYNRFENRRRMGIEMIDCLGHAHKQTFVVVSGS